MSDAGARQIPQPIQVLRQHGGKISRKAAKAQRKIDTRHLSQTLSGFLCDFASLREILSFPKVEGEPQFKAALIKDGWVVTDDPLHMRYGGQDMYVDLGAEEVIAAEKAGRRIAVEIKSFVGHSSIADLEVALGQFNLYRDMMEKTDPDRILYLAVTEETFLDVFEEPLGK